MPVLLASFYGLRRSEVLGLKWDAIDFEANTMEVKRIVTQASIDGKKSLFRPTVQKPNPVCAPCLWCRPSVTVC